MTDEIQKTDEAQDASINNTQTVDPISADNIPAAAANAQTMGELIDSGVEIRTLKAGDMVEGTLISVGKNEVYINIDGYGVGVVRGRELYDDEATLSSLKAGDKIFVSVVEPENKEGIVELSMRQAGQERVWQTLKEKRDSKELIQTKILEANKGGLMVEINNVIGFLPVSQLSLDHYPRVEDGDKSKILQILQSFVGQKFDVQIITADSEEEKLIVSEKAVHEDETEKKLSKLEIGQVVEGNITGVVDFGAFVKFGELEGLVHISELAWQRIENPKDIVKVGDKIKAKVISIEKGRVSLSVKQLKDDPWLEAVKKYQIGQKIKGIVSKIMPFGVFVELDKDIQGLAHIMELSHETVKNPEDILKIGEELEFKIISIEPAEHRLGLSLKQMKETLVKEKKEEIDSPKISEENLEGREGKLPEEKSQKEEKESDEKVSGNKEELEKE